MEECSYGVLGKYYPILAGLKLDLRKDTKNTVQFNRARMPLDIRGWWIVLAH
jgi:hypothetical protein